MNFWEGLFEKKRPILGLSPMDGVTDAPMRYMTAKYGKPDVIFTEFVSVDALQHVTDSQKAAKVMRALRRSVELLPPIDRAGVAWPFEVAQVFGHKPELFYKAAVLVAALGFDGMDINMGCPASKVEELGSGAGLIRTPYLAVEIVRQAKQGVADFAAGKVGLGDLSYSQAVVAAAQSFVESVESRGVKKKSGEVRREIPVSVKTRIGVEKDQVEEWIPKIMEAKPAVLSLHGRTLKQLYQGKADWEAIGRAAKIVHAFGGKILGNGDVKSRAEAILKWQQYGVDGVLIGRAAEGNPGVFAGIDEPSKEQRIKWLLEHAEIYNQMFVEKEETIAQKERAFVPMRKHLAWYAAGFAGAAEIRQRLVCCKSLEEVKKGFVMNCLG